MQSALDFSGKVVIVTGGGKGVGKGISERFLEAGADVAICGRSEPESLPTANGRTAFYRALDVRDPDAVQAFVSEVAEHYGRIDVLVNNAGGAPFADAATASPRFSESIVRLNLLAPLFFAQACNAVMQQQQSGGSIVNIASVSAQRPSPGTAAYGAAKAGLMGANAMLANPLATIAAATKPKSAEEAELDELDFLGIKGRTPGGTRWRNRAHGYNTRSTAAAAATVEAA